MGIRTPDGQPLLSRRARVWLMVAFASFVLLLLGPPLIEAYTNWLWFGEVGFRRV